MFCVWQGERVFVILETMSHEQKLLRTHRLDLVAATLRHIEAELESPQALGALLEVCVPPGWPPGEHDRHALEFFRDQLQAGGAVGVGWYVWYALSRDSTGRRQSLVGAAGYLGPPSNGSVEIGYSVVAEERARGYATEIVGALVTHAFTHPAVEWVAAHTSDANLPSTRVLLRCGFTRMGPGSEPGSVDYRRDRDRGIGASSNISQNTTFSH
jgi:RimJ/RimL family protein N-acetyltransferase